MMTSHASQELRYCLPRDTRDKRDRQDPNLNRLMDDGFTCSFISMEFTSELRVFHPRGKTAQEICGITYKMRLRSLM